MAGQIKGKTRAAVITAANKADGDFTERHYDEIVSHGYPGRFANAIAAVMNAADSRRRAAYVLAGIRPGDLAVYGSWPVEIERLGVAWPDPALPSLADGMTASEAREQVNGYLTAALNITTPPVGIVVIAADWRYRLTGGYNRTWLRVDTSRNKESSHDR